VGYFETDEKSAQMDKEHNKKDEQETNRKTKLNTPNYQHRSKRMRQETKTFAYSYLLKIKLAEGLRKKGVNKKEETKDEEERERKIDHGLQPKHKTSRKKNLDGSTSSKVIKKAKKILKISVKTTKMSLKPRGTAFGGVDSMFSRKK
jgi:hypothetical protein